MLKALDDVAATINAGVQRALSLANPEENIEPETTLRLEEWSEQAFSAIETAKEVMREDLLRTL